MTQQALLSVARYLLTFLLCSFFGLLHRFVNYVTIEGGKRAYVFTLTLLAAIFVPLQACRERRAERRGHTEARVAGRRRRG